MPAPPTLPPSALKIQAKIGASLLVDDREKPAVYYDNWKGKSIWDWSTQESMAAVKAVLATYDGPTKSGPFINMIANTRYKEELEKLATAGEWITGTKEHAYLWSIYHRTTAPEGRQDGLSLHIIERLPLPKRWCRKVDGFDLGTLWYPLMPGSGHRFLEDDNARLLRSDSGDTSGSVAGCCRARPSSPPHGDDNARSSIVGFPPKQHEKLGI